MTKQYVLNIRTGIIHRKKRICHLGKRIKQENKKSFDQYQEAVDYYDNDSMKAHKCAVCFPEERTIGGSQ